MKDTANAVQTGSPRASTMKPRDLTRHLRRGGSITLETPEDIAARDAALERLNAAATATNNGLHKRVAVLPTTLAGDTEPLDEPERRARIDEVAGRHRLRWEEFTSFRKGQRDYPSRSSAESWRARFLAEGPDAFLDDFEGEAR